MEKANPKLKALLALWEEKRGGRRMPARGDLSMRALKPWLGSLAFIDVSDLKHARFRLSGTNLRVRFDGEMTGRPIEALDDSVAASLRAAVWRAYAEAKPVESIHRAETNDQPLIFKEIYLPLANDGTQVDTILLASFPVQKR